MKIISDIITVLLTADRRKRQERELKQANIRRVSSPKVFGTNIKSVNDPDHSESFKPWGRGW